MDHPVSATLFCVYFIITPSVMQGLLNVYDCMVYEDHDGVLQQVARLDVRAQCSQDVRWWTSFVGVFALGVAVPLAYSAFVFRAHSRRCEPQDAPRAAPPRNPRPAACGPCRAVVGQAIRWHNGKLAQPGLHSTESVLRHGRWYQEYRKQVCAWWECLQFFVKLAHAATFSAGSGAHLRGRAFAASTSLAVLSVVGIAIVRPHRDRRVHDVAMLHHAGIALTAFAGLRLQARDDPAVTNALAGVSVCANAAFVAAMSFAVARPLLR
eukprot:gene1751-9177_t